MGDLPLLDPNDFAEKESCWRERREMAKRRVKLRSHQSEPKGDFITEETRRGLKRKALFYLVRHDEKGNWRYLLRHPLAYAYRYLRSLFSKQRYHAEGDLFYYGVRGEDEFQEAFADGNALFVLGFSYCHKPFECPSGRFSPDCIHDPDHDVCAQCFIGRAVSSTPKTNSVVLIIPTIHFIGEKILAIRETFPQRRILFLITACELCLEMFADFGNMVAIQGVGVRLRGRVCNTWRAFELSEEGVKPGLTRIEEGIEEWIISKIHQRHRSIISNDSSSSFCKR